MLKYYNNQLLLLLYYRYSIREVKQRRACSMFGWVAAEDNIGCSFICFLKAGVEESIVNTPLVSLQSKSTTTQKVRLDLKSGSVIRNLWWFAIDPSTPT
jgi:hypothetical protein